MILDYRTSLGCRPRGMEGDRHWGGPLVVVDAGTGLTGPRFASPQAQTAQTCSSHPSVLLPTLQQTQRCRSL